MPSTSAASKRAKTSVKAYADKAMKHIAKNNLFSAVAHECGIARQAPYQWQRVPAERALAVHKVTGLPLHVIRSDLYPRA